jgi:hypothetical protein
MMPSVTGVPTSASSSSAVTSAHTCARSGVPGSDESEGGGSWVAAEVVAGSSTLLISSLEEHPETTRIVASTTPAHLSTGPTSVRGAWPPRW